TGSAVTAWSIAPNHARFGGVPKGMICGSFSVFGARAAWYMPLASVAHPEPVRMLLHHLRNDVFVRFPLAVSVFPHQRIPPELRIDALLVEIIRHFLDGITG